jgi:hypothetical protein
MNQFKRIVLLMAALVLAVGLAACGGSDSGDETVNGTFEPLAEGGAGYENVAGEAELTRADGETTVAISLDGLAPDTEYMAHLHTGGCADTDPGGAHFRFDPEGGEMPPNEIHLAFGSNGDGSGEAEVTNDQEVPAGEAGSVVLHLADEAMAAGRSSQQFAALLVHEGVDHSKGETHGDGHEAPAQPDKIACAELEGGTDTAASGPEIEVAGDRPVGGVQKLEFDAGEQVHFSVTGDEAEEVHVHGYDLSEQIPPGGGTVEFSFPADIEGIFEIELEAKAVLIAELQVNP